MKQGGQWYGRALERKIIASIQACTGVITIRTLVAELHQSAPYLNKQHLYRRVYRVILNLSQSGDVVTETGQTSNKTPILFIRCSEK